MWEAGHLWQLPPYTDPPSIDVYLVRKRNAKCTSAPNPPFLKRCGRRLSDKRLPILEFAKAASLRLFGTRGEGAVLIVERRISRSAELNGDHRTARGVEGPADAPCLGQVAMSCSKRSSGSLKPLPATPVRIGEAEVGEGPSDYDVEFDKTFRSVPHRRDLQHQRVLPCPSPAAFQPCNPSPGGATPASLMQADSSRR